MKKFYTHKKKYNKINKRTKSFFQKGRGLEEDYDILLIQYMKTMCNIKDQSHILSDKDLIIKAKSDGSNFIKLTNFTKRQKDALMSYQADFYKYINFLLWNKSKNATTEMPKEYIESFVYAAIIYDTIKNYGFRYDNNLTVFRIFSNIDSYNTKLINMNPYSFIEFNSFLSTSAIKPYSNSNNNLRKCAKIIIPLNTPFLILSVGAGENEILLNPGTLLKINSGTSECILGDFIYLPFMNERIKTYLESIITNPMYKRI